MSYPTRILFLFLFLLEKGSNFHLRHVVRSSNRQNSGATPTHPVSGAEEHKGQLREFATPPLLKGPGVSLIYIFPLLSERCYKLAIINSVRQ